MTSAVFIRRARASDAEPLGRLGALLVAEHHEFDPQRFIVPVANLAARYGDFLVSQLKRPEMIVLVAEREGALVGYAYAGMEGNDYMALRGPAGVLYDLVVDPDHRRQGSARRYSMPRWRISGSSARLARFCSPLRRTASRKPCSTAPIFAGPWLR